MVYIISTESGEIREHQLHEASRRAGYLSRMGIAFTVRVAGE